MRVQPLGDRTCELNSVVVRQLAAGARAPGNKNQAQMKRALLGNPQPIREGGKTEFAVRLNATQIAQKGCRMPLRSSSAGPVPCASSAGNGVATAEDAT
jgi:hypothetical protein